MSVLGTPECRTPSTTAVLGEQEIGPNLLDRLPEQKQCQQSVEFPKGMNRAIQWFYLFRFISKKF
jgi:hypothetical protein